MDKMELFQIDVEAVLKEKNPKLLTRLPRFFIKWLKKIVHQEEINEFLKKNSEKFDLDFVEEAIRYFNLEIEVNGYENIPNSGRFVFAANHPLGALESIVLMKVVSGKYNKFAFVVNDILMFMKPISGMFVPVNKHGSQSKDSIIKLNEVYRSDKQILFFPAGLVSRKRKGQIKDLKWQKSFVSKAIETERDIIPVYIGGCNSNFFYNLARLRGFLKIKANIEMLFLVDEMMKQRNQKISITFGQPISYKFFDQSKTFADWAEYLRELVYTLKKQKS
jgi:1-acyl-sn-glycerol-3-phosphate acyltransferase